MRTVFFNSFKERLAKGELSETITINCFPVTSKFFDTFDTDDYKVENFRTFEELSRKGLVSTLFDYTIANKTASYCCELLTEPAPIYTDETYNGMKYSVVISPVYKYLSAQMNYRYEDNPANAGYKPATDAIASGTLMYSPMKKLLVHFDNHPVPYSDNPNFKFSDTVVNDGTVLYMGYVPAKQVLVEELSRNGTTSNIFPITGSEFQGFLFVDTEGNLIQFIDFEEPQDFKDGCFVYTYPGPRYDIDIGTGSLKWAVFANLN